jgi:hypothetical protein
VESGAAGGDDDAVEVLLAGAFSDEVLSGIRAHVPVIFCYDDIREGFGVFDEGGDVDDTGDVGAAVADEDADFGGFS